MTSPSRTVVTWDDEPAPVGHVLIERRVGVRRSLLDWWSPQADPFTWTKMPHLDASLVEDVLAGSPGAPGLVQFESEVVESNPGARPDLWKIGHLDGRAAAVVMPAMTDDVGAFLLIGLLGWARGRGWGTRLHAQGLTALRTAGARVYVDEADVANAAMRKVFARNDCRQVGVLSYWQPALRPLCSQE